jgi:two-component system, chemotaxis family, CheB/CheR fusion protein
MTNSQGGELERLLEFLRRTRRFDFSGYKQASLMRRIEKRMRAIGLSSYAEFMGHLEAHPDEFPHLFNTILVNVTSFFRDSAAWERVVQDVVPQLLEAKAPNEPIRVWSAGGASGEEAYSLAMVLAEALGRGPFLRRVQIFATDVDEEALGHARRAAYGTRTLAGVPPQLLAKYFAADGGGRYVFDAELRRIIAFGVHDLIRDAPIARIDLLACRNTLMYFDAETQTEVLRRLHFALSGGGVLFLGRAEMLLSHVTEFTPIDAKRRLFQKTAKSKVAITTDEAAGRLPPSQIAKEFAEAETRRHLLESAFDASANALALLDTRGLLIAANEHARGLFAIGPNDVGRPLHDLDFARRPVELMPLVGRAFTDGRSTTVKDVLHATALGDAYFELRIVPLRDAKSSLGVLIAFLDVTAHRRLQAEVNALTSELETAFGAPASTEMETQSGLQSGGTELETIQAELLSVSEQLQSTNQELKTMSDELRARADDLLGETAVLTSVFASLRAGLIVVDSDLVVKICNRRAAVLCGLLSDEPVGKHLSKLALRLPFEVLRGAIRSCLSGESEYVESVVPLTTRRGRTIRCRIACTPLVQLDRPVGAVMLIDRDTR